MDKNKKKKVIGVSCLVLGTAFIGLNAVSKKKKPDSIYDNDPDQKNELEGKRVVFIEDENCKENADGVRGYLKEIGESNYNPTFYDKYVKRSIDVILSFGGLVVLSPVMATIAFAIKMEDPGPVLFTQKRMGQNKQYFKLHKFRSMKMNTPHDVPTHQLENPDQYITKVGKFIRAHSLDELPQIWDIFIGNMSVIGPRPGLWNQDLLTAERDKYNANDIKPGLTGWAQINGRDELEIPVKAKLDGEYVKNESLLFDMKCFLGTVSKIGHDDSVVEGGTGEMSKNVGRDYTCDKSHEGLIGNVGFGEAVSVDVEKRIKVLIVGKGSYIGESFKNYAIKNYNSNFEIDEVDTMSPDWKDIDFRKYDIVYHVAGIAHADVGNVSNEIKEKYYQINTDLAIEVAEKAKNDGVKEFVFMSSMIVYGDSAPYGTVKIIDKNTIPNPANFYGDSKLQADVAVRDLADDNFKVIVLRPPMIYGKGSKGNYPLLAKLAKISPVFPDIENQRSMLHIDNLCEFLCQIMLVDVKQNATVLIPQNREWTKTSDMVKEIANVSNKKTIVTKLLNPSVYIAHKIPGKISGLIDKAFGNNCYDLELSEYEGINYQKLSLKESINSVEGMVEVNKLMPNKYVLIIASVASMIDQFNMANIKILQELGYGVDVACNFENGSTCSLDRVELLKKKLNQINVNCYQIDFTRDVTNISLDKKAYNQLKDIVIKNNYLFMHCHSPIGGVIGRLVAHETNTKVMYTAHGFHFFKGAPIKNWILYYPIEKFLSKWTDWLITINNEDYNLACDKFCAKNIIKIPGVGVDINKFKNTIYDPSLRKTLGLNDDDFVLISVGELNENKNHMTIIKAIHSLNNAKIKYIIVGIGPLREELNQMVHDYGLENQIIFLGYRDDVPKLLKICNAFCFPSKREGLGLAAIEAMASGLPLITSNVHGINDYSKNGLTGFSYDPSDYGGFAKGIEILMNDYALCEKISINNITASEKYNLLNVNAIMKGIYIEISKSLE